MDWQEMLSWLLKLSRGLAMLAIAACLIMGSITVCHVAYLLFRFVSMFVQQVLFGRGG